MPHKKSFLILTLFTLLIISQQTAAQVTVGIRGGVNFSGLDGEQFTTESIVAYQIGIFMSAAFWDSPLAFQPEVLYSRMGAKIDEKRIELSYIKIPLLFKYTFKKAPDFSTYMVIGPYVSFNIEDKNNTIDTKIGDNLNSVIYGGVIGLGFRIRHFITALRYSRAANPYSEREQAGFHSVISITAGFEF